MIDGVLRFNPVTEGTDVEAEVRLDCVGRLRGHIRIVYGPHLWSYV
jgi:hypothetical protein